MNDSRPLHLLRDALKAVAPYPRGVLAVPEPIKGTAFFPGGDGLWKEDGPIEFPIGGIMILGHDFDSNDGYQRSLEARTENMKGATWSSLSKVLHEARIEPASCFFTNFYMGLREVAKATGPFPGRMDEGFVDRCREFLLYQIDLSRPRAILVLGIHVPPLIATMAPELLVWNEVRQFGDIDAANHAVIERVCFRPGKPTIPVAAMTHPCQRHLNIKRRKYHGLEGNPAEMRMIQDVLGT